MGEEKFACHGCGKFFPGETTSALGPSNRELRSVGWILLEGHIYCFECALGALAETVDRLVAERSEG